MKLFQKNREFKDNDNAKTKSSNTQCLLYFLKTEVQGYQIWYFLPNFQQQITKKIPHKFSIKYFSHQIFSTNKFHSNILPKMFYQKISTKSVPPSFFLFHISLMTNSRSFLLIVLYHLCMYYNCLLVLDLCNKDSILDHSNFSQIFCFSFSKSSPRLPVPSFSLTLPSWATLQ